MPQVSRGRRASHKEQPTADMAGGVRLSIGLILLGIILRLVVSGISKGTNDAAAWFRFGDEINHHGLIDTYRMDPEFNHPPIPAYWAAVCARISGSEDSSWHDSIFTCAFKLPVVLADGAGIYLLWLIWRKRTNPPGAVRVAAWFALSLDAILISAYHCNTDPIYVMLCLLCAYLLERQRHLAAGLALGAAINIKLIPVLLIVPMLLTVKNRTQAFRFVAGLALWVLPFVPLLVLARKAFLTNVLMYNSMVDRWGIDYFLLLGEEKWSPANHGEQLTAVYYAYARYLIFALILSWALLTRWLRKWSAYEIAAVTFAIFLIFVPGFGVQYTVMLGLLLFAIRPVWASVYAWIAGLFALSAYWIYWTGSFPLLSRWSLTLLPEPAGMLGLITWIFVIATVVLVVALPVRPANRIIA